jgi:hypothetical protein
MNKILLKYLVGLIALALAVCAAFFSIAGLAKLFAGAATAVIIMASTLEASKLVIASFLYQYWDTVSKALRAYLLTAVTIIAIITSIGIYGYLSGAYQETKSKYDLTRTLTDSLSTQKSFYQSSVDNFKLQLDSKNAQLSNLTSIRNSQENRATQLVTSNQSSNSADRSARRTDSSIKLLNAEIDDLNKKLITYSDSVSKVSVAITKASLKNDLSSELGSLSYISKILNVPMDNIVNVLILLFIIVFDPLAICMVLVFNFMNRKEEIPNIAITSDNTDSEPKINFPADLPEETELEPLEPTIIVEAETVPTETTNDEINPVTDANTEPIIDEQDEWRRRKLREKMQRLYSGAVTPDSKTY